jgi:hypothetical protein
MAENVGKQNAKKIFNILVPVINIGLLYYFGLQIYNYSFNISYNCVNTFILMEIKFLILSIVELFKLICLLIGICAWVSFYESINEYLEYS